MDHTLPVNRSDPAVVIVAGLRGQVKFNRKATVEFSAFSFCIEARFHMGTKRSLGAWRLLAPMRGRRQKGVL
jgi:hypothetical protein